MKMIGLLFQSVMCQVLKIKDFNVLIDGKPFFQIHIKIEEQAYEQIVAMSGNTDSTTGNLLDYEYLSKHHKLIKNRSNCYGNSKDCKFTE